MWCFALRAKCVVSEKPPFKIPKFKITLPCPRHKNKKGSAAAIMRLMAPAELLSGCDRTF